MRFLFRSRKRLGDALLCLPGALHLSRRGHEVWIECPREWHSMFEWVSYARPCAGDCPVPDRTFDTNLLDMTLCPSPIIDYINDAFQELADAPRGQPVIFDRRPTAAPDPGPPRPYTLVAPFGYSQFRTPPPEWTIAKTRWLLGGGVPNLFVLSDRAKDGLGAPCVMAGSIRDLPGLIAGAEEIVTINSSPNIIASAVRRSHFMVWDEDIVGGRTNYIVPNQIILRYNSGMGSGAVNPVFASWYARDGQGSGPGSLPEYTAAYRHLINDLIRTHRARSVLDFGCGDWQFSRLIDWGEALYYGVDVVPELIARLRKEYGAPDRVFFTVDPQDPELPNAVDLVVCKDVLQHLSNAEILRLLERFKVAKRWLLVNDIHPSLAENNKDIATGGYRCLDLSAPPFSLPGKEVYRFPPQPHTPELPKIAFLVEVP